MLRFFSGVASAAAASFRVGKTAANPEGAAHPPMGVPENLKRQKQASSPTPTESALPASDTLAPKHPESSGKPHPKAPLSSFMLAFERFRNRNVHSAPPQFSEQARKFAMPSSCRFVPPLKHGDGENTFLRLAGANKPTLEVVPECTATKSGSSSPRAVGNDLKPVVAAIGTGLLETTIFHPAESAIKRLMTRKDILPKDRSFWAGIPGLYNGIGTAGLSTILKRITRYGGQEKTEQFLREWLNEPEPTPITHALAGTAVGLLEVVWTPLDRFKVLRQTGSSLSFSSMAAQQGWPLLYAGSIQLALRNGTSGGILFCVNASQEQSDELQQKFLNSLKAGTAAVTASHFFDYVKVRMQVEQRTARQVLSAMVQYGPEGFFTSLGAKLPVKATKLAVGLLVYNEIRAFLDSEDSPF